MLPPDNCSSACSALCAVQSDYPLDPYRRRGGKEALSSSIPSAVSVCVGRGEACSHHARLIRDAGCASAQQDEHIIRLCMFMLLEGATAQQCAVPDICRNEDQ